MSESILRSIAKNIGLPEEYNVFDPDQILLINGVLADLHQIGIGPEEGFQVTDDTTTWDELLQGEMRLNNVKTLVYIRVKLLFDSGSLTGAVITSMEKMADRLEYRINLFREEQFHDQLSR